MKILYNDKHVFTRRLYATAWAFTMLLVANIYPNTNPEEPRPPKEKPTTSTETPFKSRVERIGKNPVDQINFGLDIISILLSTDIVTKNEQLSDLRSFFTQLKQLCSSPEIEQYTKLVPVVLEFVIKTGEAITSNKSNPQKRKIVILLAENMVGKVITEEAKLTGSLSARHRQKIFGNENLLLGLEKFKVAMQSLPLLEKFTAFTEERLKTTILIAGAACAILIAVILYQCASLATTKHLGETAEVIEATMRTVNFRTNGQPDLALWATGLEMTLAENNPNLLLAELESLAKYLNAYGLPRVAPLLTMIKVAITHLQRITSTSWWHSSKHANLETSIMDQAKVIIAAITALDNLLRLPQLPIGYPGILRAATSAVDAAKDGPLGNGLSILLTKIHKYSEIAFAWTKEAALDYISHCYQFVSKLFSQTTF